MKSKITVPVTFTF